MKYVCLLRGVNVGGNKKVEMAKLRMLFEDLGYSDVSTYINSGNVIFASRALPDRETLAAAISTKFGFDALPHILSAKQVMAIANAIPKSWSNDGSSKSDVAYLFGDIDEPEVIKKIGYKPEVEVMRYVPGAVLFSIDRSNVHKSSLHKTISMPIYKMMTVRNVNTARKLAELVA